MNHLVAIVGPTGVGKSRLALRLAQTFEGEIVSADSRQVYRHMDIGTGKAATAKQANETIGLIRHNIFELYNKRAAQNVRILYGGSVTAANATEFINQPEIDGALVGGASIRANQFLSIVKQAAETKNCLSG